MEVSAGRYIGIRYTELLSCLFEKYFFVNDKSVTKKKLPFNVYTEILKPFGCELNYALLKFGRHKWPELFQACHTQSQTTVTRSAMEQSVALWRHEGRYVTSWDLCDVTRSAMWRHEQRYMTSRVERRLGVVVWRHGLCDVMRMYVTSWKALDDDMKCCVTSCWALDDIMKSVMRSCDVMRCVTLPKHTMTSWRVLYDVMICDATKARNDVMRSAIWRHG